MAYILKGGHGGRRAGAGKPKGAKNKRRPALRRAKDRGQTLPLDYMLKILNDEKQPIERRDKMAIHAAPYLHPRLIGSPIAKAAFEMSDSELAEVIRRQEEHERQVADLEAARAVLRRPVLAVSNE